jgi:ferredoxin
MCVGCGLCTTRCKFDAIHLEKRFDVGGRTYEQIAPSSVPHILARNLKIIFTGKGKTEDDQQGRDRQERDAKKETIK